MGKRRRSSDDSSSDDVDEKNKKSAPIASSGSSSSSEDEGEWNEKPKKNKKKTAKVAKKVSKEMKVKAEEEREEGEVDDDDEDDDDEETEQFDDGFDENLMGDDEDKARLAQMTEKEREQELFNRGEKREVLRTRFDIERKLRLQKKKENQKSKSFTEASLRSNERRRNMEDKRKQKDALKGLKEMREKKKQKQQKLRAVDVYSSSSDSDDDDDDKKKKSSSSSSSSSSDSDSDSDVGYKKKSKRGDDRRGSGGDRESDEEKPDDYVVTLQDLNTIRISRNRLALWCHMPYFSQTVTGCFVKIGIGAKGGQSIYRVAQITEVVEGTKIYNLDATKTNKQLRLKHGRDERLFRLEYVSNQDFAANEFTEWKERMERDKFDLPTRSLIENKRKDIMNSKNYSFNDSDIDGILIEKKKFRNNPNNYAVAKTELMKIKERAEQEHDDELLASTMAELDSLEERAKELDKARTNSIAAISFINERNRIRNIAEAEKAIMAEREDRQKEGEVDDPFRRRNCRPTLVHKFHKKVEVPLLSGPLGENGMKVESVDTVDGVNGIKAEPNDPKKLSIIPIPIKIESKAASPTRSDDLFSAHNFDIQIDFEPNAHMAHANSHSNHSLALHAATVTPIVKPTNRRSLNLEEYKKKKGLI